MGSVCANLYYIIYKQNLSLRRKIQKQTRKKYYDMKYIELVFTALWYPVIIRYINILYMVILSWGKLENSKIKAITL